MDIQRFTVLDTYRYLAAAGIVLFHCQAAFQVFLAHPAMPFVELNLFVDFFFILSGFVLMHTYGDRVRNQADFVRFMQKRLARIYPLHAATTIAFIVMDVLIVVLHLNDDHRVGDDLALAPATLLLVHAWGFTAHDGLNYPSWSISAELFVYLLFPLFAVILRRIGGVRTLALAVILAAVIVEVRAMANLRPMTDATYDFGNMRAVPTFLAGMAINVLVKDHPRPVPWWLAHLAGILVLVLMLAKAPTLAIVGIMPLVIWLIAHAEINAGPSRLSTPLFQKLGEASYGVYLIHALVLTVLAALLKHLHHPSVLLLVVIAVGVLVVTTALAMASYRWFENPLRIYLGTIARARVATRPQ
ncbi:MAG: acyltransferase [Hyphomicrobiales bacterium]|nr:acyltransferase [Hyphomicrobiales bacterium]MDE2115120.1 acyltransferase [Hyphomicrobiales bacterium]